MGQNNFIVNPPFKASTGEGPGPVNVILRDTTGAYVAAGGASMPVGSTNLASSQVTTSGTAGTLAIARATRNSVLFRNLDATISVYIGPATVTTANGMLLKAGESVVLNSVGLIQVIAASGTPVVAVLDEYN